VQRCASCAWYCKCSFYELQGEGRNRLTPTRGVTRLRAPALCSRGACICIVLTHHTHVTARVSCSRALHARDYARSYVALSRVWLSVGEASDSVGRLTPSPFKANSVWFGCG
jgi:hypothetical protein